jgi:hypothetical protein
VFPFGRSFRSPHAGAEGGEDTSLGGGILWGFASIWLFGFALTTLLGEQAPMRAPGGPFAPQNLLFFIVLELIVGAVGGLITLRREERSALVRLAIVVVIAGTAIALLAADGPEHAPGVGIMIARCVLNALGVLVVLHFAWRRTKALTPRGASELLHFVEHGLPAAPRQTPRSEASEVTSDEPRTTQPAAQPRLRLVGHEDAPPPAAQDPST